MSKDIKYSNESDGLIIEWIESLGGGEIDVELAKVLYQKAMGYSHEIEHISQYQDKIIKTPVIKQYPPDYKSIELMLKWRGLIDAEKESSYEMPDQSVIDANREEARKLQEKWGREQKERKNQLVSLGVCFEIGDSEV